MKRAGILGSGRQKRERFLLPWPPCGRHAVFSVSPVASSSLVTMVGEMDLEAVMGQSPGQLFCRVRHIFAADIDQSVAVTKILGLEALWAAS